MKIELVIEWETHWDRSKCGVHSMVIGLSLLDIWHVTYKKERYFKLCIQFWFRSFFFFLIEYIATTNNATQVIWLHKMLFDFKHTQEIPIMIFCDNKLVIAFIKNLVFHGKSNYIDIKFHYTNDLVKDKEIMFEFCSSENQVTNIFTKSIKGKHCSSWRRWWVKM